MKETFDLLDVKCPTCSAEVGEPCTMSRTDTREGHSLRRKKAAKEHIENTTPPMKGAPIHDAGIAQDYEIVERPRSHLVVIEAVFDRAEDAYADERVEEALDALNAAGMARVVSAQLLHSTYESACEVLTKRAREEK